MSFAAVPLYRAFCAATGYGGTPQIGAAASPGHDLATDHRALQRRRQSRACPGVRARTAPVTLKLGEEQLAFYEARNEADAPVTGVAALQRDAGKVGKYFHKTACFCFNQQTLAPGQAMEFPVSFWVDPALANDPRYRGRPHHHAVLHILPLAGGRGRTGALANAGPHVGATPALI